MASRSPELGPSMEEATTALPNVGAQLVASVTGVAFWSAVALPFLHLPLLLATGLSSQSTATAFVALVALNALALLVGHSHYRD